jgi:hypothetical protein
MLLILKQKYWNINNTHPLFKIYPKWVKFNFYKLLYSKETVEYMYMYSTVHVQVHVL